MEQFITELGILGKFLLSLILGFLIGLEREIAEKPAGVRTYMLVAASGTAFTILGLEMLSYMQTHFPDSNLATDPTRIVHAIIVGVSFLGAGTILKDKANNSIQNLSTAATVLICATIGISVAVEKYYLAIGITIIILFVNWIMLLLKKWVEKKQKN